MANTYHDQLTDSDLHINKIYSDTGVELSTASLATLDARWSLKNHLKVGPYGTINNDYTAANGSAQQAINAASLALYNAGGGILELAKGTFLTNGTITQYPTVQIVGQGMGATTLMGSTGDYVMMGTTKSTTSKTVYNKIGLKCLTLASQKGHCLVISNTSGVMLDEVEMYFTVTTPIRESLVVQHSQFIHVGKCYLHDLTGNGVQINGSDYFSVANNTVVGGANADDLIDIDKDFLDTKTVQSNYGSVVGNNVSNGQKGNGIRVAASNQVTVTGNTVTGVSTSGGAGILANAYSNAEGANTCQSIIIVGNTVDNCATDGIRVEASGTNYVNDCIVSTNTLTNCGQAGGTNIHSGIMLANPDVSVMGNRLNNCGKAGADGGSIVVFKYSKQHVTNNKIKNAAGIGFNLWNGDGLQGYTDIEFTHNSFENVPTPISAGALVSGFIRDNQGADNITPISFAQDGLAVGANQLVTKNGNVGVWTANPAAKFEVHDDQASSNEIGSISIRGAADPTKRLNFGYNEAADYAWIQAVKNGTAKRKIYVDTLGLGLGTNAPTSMLDVNDNRLRVRTANTPSSATDTGNQGDICWDANFVYICTATNSWKRVAIGSW